MRIGIILLCHHIVISKNRKYERENKETRKIVEEKDLIKSGIDEKLDSSGKTKI